MSNYISGNMDQSIRSDLGDFIKIGESLRIRKEHIMFYGTGMSAETIEQPVLLISTNGSVHLPVKFDSQEDMDKELDRLDRIFELSPPLEAVK